METNGFSRANIEAYKAGCEQVAVTLDDAINGVLKEGKKPTILIPSRGAVPIYLIAAAMLGAVDNQHILLDKERTRYYPDRIFEYLSDGRIQENGPVEPEVEVILYPFTADVSSEGKEEHLARQFRYSATRAYLDLISGDRSSLDLNWYFFLMSKMESRAYKDHELTPAGIIESLTSLKPSDNRQTILLDTVISGRASSQILESFNDLSHPALPILVVDELEGSNRVQPKFRRTIEENMAWYQYMAKSEEDALIKFPLITEDKGAALLGVSAINFGNFNETGYFHSADSRFSRDFLPQSCVWALPPSDEVSSSRASLRDVYIGAFHKFLDRCVPVEGQDLTEEEWDKALRDIRCLTGSHGGSIDFKVIRAMAKVDKETTAHESSSHIVTIQLTPRQSLMWAREFASRFDHK
jgi:hypothetical protein